MVPKMYCRPHFAKSQARTGGNACRCKGSARDRCRAARAGACPLPFPPFPPLFPRARLLSPFPPILLRRRQSTNETRTGATAEPSAGPLDAGRRGRLRPAVEARPLMRRQLVVDRLDQGGANPPHPTSGGDRLHSPSPSTPAHGRNREGAWAPSRRCPWLPRARALSRPPQPPGHPCPAPAPPCMPFSRGADGRGPQAAAIAREGHRRLCFRRLSSRVRPAAPLRHRPARPTPPAP